MTPLPPDQQRDLETVRETAHVLSAMWPDDARLRAYEQQHKEALARIEAALERLNSGIFLGKPAKYWLELRERAARMDEALRRIADENDPLEGIGSEMEFAQAALAPPEEGASGG